MANEGVSRGKRRLFTYAVVGGATALALLLALAGLDTRVAQIVAEGLMTMALATTCTYIGASAVDYSFGDRGALRRGGYGASYGGYGGYQPPQGYRTPTGGDEPVSSRAD